MRQRGDSDLYSLLNKIRKGEIDFNVEKALISRFVYKNNLSYPAHSVHMFAENNPVWEHNRIRLNERSSPLYTINAIGKISPEIELSQNQIEAIDAWKIIDTGNSAGRSEIKTGAQVMLPANINLKD